MTIINTARNRVHAHAIGDDDVFVQAALLTPGDTPGTMRPRTLRYQPITDYQALVDWAVSMADQLAYPIHIQPLSYADIRNSGRFAPICAAVASMDDQQRGQFRREVVTTCCGIMRDCDDWQVRADAYDILTQLKVIHHD